MRIGHRADHRVVEVRAARNRRPRLGHNAVLRVVRAQLRLGEPGVQLHLVEHRGDAGGLNNLVEHLRVEVRHAHRLQLTHPLQLRELLEGLHVCPVLRPRPVHEVQVHEVEVQALERLFIGLGHALLVVVPQFRGHEQLFTGDVASLDGVVDRLAHLDLVVVQRSGVDVAVAQLDGGSHDRFHLVARQLVRAQAKEGEIVAVVQCRHWDAHRGSPSWRRAGR